MKLDNMEKLDALEEAQRHLEAALESLNGTGCALAIDFITDALESVNDDIRDLEPIVDEELRAEQEYMEREYYASVI